MLTASPDDVPPIDPRAMMDLETHARNVAINVDHMMASLQNSLHKVFHCSVNG